MVLQYIRSILVKEWRSLFFVGFILFISKINFIPSMFQPSTHNLIEFDKCPACYGASACNFVHEIDITPQDFYSLFSHFLGVKNVFFGRHKGRRIVLKKLAHNSELDNFDQMLCEVQDFNNLCTESSGLNEKDYKVNFRALIEQEITSDFEKDDSVRLRVCPTTKNLDHLFRNIYGNNEKVDKVILDINLWTLVKINPEPLILQILSAEDGWPVPKYFGACGRIIVEEYVGSPLIDYYKKSWLQRAKIGISLLNAARRLTSQKDYGFYLTDVSADNIAVDAEDNAKFIDLENIIIVDKNASIVSENWKKLQENRIEPICSDSFAFSPADICNHQISDHNYYAICQLLWKPEKCGNSAEGFLHDVPIEIERKYPHLKSLMNKCVLADPRKSRIQFGDDVERLLREITQEMDGGGV